MSSDTEFDPDEHLLIHRSDLEEARRTVLDHADKTPDVTFAAGMVEGVEHYDRLIEALAE